MCISKWNEMFKRSVAGLLSVVMLFGMLPNLSPVHAVEEEEDLLAGKTISILGASISTYAGTSNGAAADTTNSTIRSNAKYYPHSVVTDVKRKDTWWMQVADDLGLRLLVNNSWSGSSLLYERNGTKGAYVDRCVQLHDDTGDNCGETPDIIGIQMGTNDFQYYKDTLGTADIDYQALITENTDGTYTYAAPVTSLEAAAIVLHKISVRYPDAEVYYLNISQRIDGTDELIRSFNAELKQVVEHFGAHIVDIYGSAITMEDFDTYIGDGRVHPNKLGMDAYAEAFKRTLIANTAYTVDTHTVSLALEGVSASYGDDKIVVSGDSYTVDLTAVDALQVTVTMGGKNITDTAYADGTVIIDAVTDDVTITAKSVYTPKDYRWEFDGTDLVCVSGDNALTKNAGTTADGVFSKTRYALGTSVRLLHDQPWIVEWKCEGTFQNTNGSSGARVFTSTDVNAEYNARYIFKSNTNGILAMGEKTTTGSHNYGLALADYGIDWTELHTYRLENRIAADGSNMVWLYVDGEEIGPLNNYYVGTTDKNSTSDWLSGKDFVFPYMGTDTHGFTNASIDYVAVWEGEHAHSYVSAVTPPSCTKQGYTTYTCACGESYTDSYVDATGHRYENGVCTFCGQTESQQLVDGFEMVASIQSGDSRLVDAHNTVSPLILQDLTLFENCFISAVNLFVTGTVVDNDSTNANDPQIDDGTVYTFDLVVLDASSVKAGQHYTVKRTYTLSVPGSNIERNAWNTFDVSHLDITVKAGETLGFGSENSTLEIFYLNQCITSKLCYFGHKTTTGNTTLSLRTGFNLPVGVEGYKIKCDHEYALTVTAPTCTKLGYTTHSCVHCGDSYKDTFTDAMGHSWEEGVCTACAAGKKPYQRLTYFQVDVVGDKEKLYTDNAVLYLPANYTPDGEPVKLVIYCKQGASQITASSNPIEDVGFYNYLISLGYAVLGVDGVPDAWRDELGLGERAVGNPMAVQGTQRAYDYVVDNYNIASDGCFISGYSQGGHYAQNVIDLTNIPILAAAEQSPVCSMRYHQWDLNANQTVGGVKFTKAARLNVARIYGFPEFTTNTELLNLAYDASLVDAYDPWIRNSENVYTGFVQKSNLWYLPEGTSLDDITMKKNVKCPVKIWCAQDDTAISADVMKVFVKAIQNAGGTAEISVTSSGGHGFFQKQTAVGTFTENGKTFSTLPIAVEIAQWFEQYGGYECEHNYSGAICTICGEKAENYSGKVISILSASTSTFAGYIPVADGFNLEHRPRYPQDNLLTDVNETWWMQVIAELDAKLGINDSWAGSTVSNFQDTNSGDLGPDAAMASLTRIQNLGANGTPDVILFFGGGNDMGRGVTLGSFDPATAPTEVDLTATKWDSFADAYVATILRLQYFYPDAEIVVMLSYPMPSYVTSAKLQKYGPVIKSICDHYGVTYVDLGDCGVTFDMLPDDIHPNAEGMDYITSDVLDTLLNRVDLTAGENVVCSVTHDLTNAKASKSYYKGVSFGKAFEETLTGENLTVTVTMGGEDITSAVYADGTIRIPSVTADVVVTVKGKFDAEGHLQQLPENICAGINLWNALEPENIYYTATGWGNTAAGTTWSITFPVKEGDRIWATALGAAPANGSTANGVRVTWFDENGVLATLDRNVVYAEFAKNGYITAPEGAVALNLPMTNNQEHYAVYILSAEHSFVDDVCSVCGKEYVNPELDGHLQQLPEEICAGTNLWTELEPENEYYLGTKWGLYTSAPDVHSVTFPVTAGDLLWATSFGSSAGDKTGNGTRITWFDENGVLESVAREVVYAEFQTNGCITVPEGAIAVNVPMPTGADTWELYILNLNHNYGDWYETKVPTCEADGEERRDCGSCDAFETRAVSCAHAPEFDWDVDGDGVLEILAIGNSFSVDALEYAYQIARDLGVEQIVIGNLYIGGCTLQTHAANAAGDLAKYTYYYNDSGTWKTTGSYKISTALMSRSWDYISLQQQSGNSGIESTYNEDLTYLITYVKNLTSSASNENRNPCAKLVWHMTWAYQQNSTHSAFANYCKDQMTMYNAIVSAAQNKIVTNSNFDLIVPSGTAVQNARTSLVGDTLTRDGYHMSYDYGRFLTGLMFIKTLTGLDLDGITYAPAGVSELYREIAAESVVNAYATPFAVTQSSYTGEVPENGYILLQPELTKGGYWQPQKENKYNVVITDATNSASYFASPRFTKEELPVGSIIILEDGWQYRPDGWITDSLQTGTRESVTTAPYVVITEQWWKDYTIRSFNISKVGLPSLLDVTEEEVCAAIRIYVPEESHIHKYEAVITDPTCTESGYTTHTCTLCKDIFVDSHVDAAGHTPGEAVRENETAGGYEEVVYCETCGCELSREVVASHVPGDITGDGEVNNKDLTRLFKYLTGYDVQVNEAALDVNGDGSVNNKDQTRLFRHLSGWDVEIY